MKIDIYTISYRNIIYVGSTSKGEDRMRSHKEMYRQFLIGKGGRCVIYDYFNKYGIDNFKFRIRRTYEVFDESCARAYESLYINRLRYDKNLNVINIKPPFNVFCIFKKRHEQQYRSTEEQKEKNKKYQKEYRTQIISDEEKVNARKERMKTYQEKNKEKIKQKNKEWQNKKVACLICLRIYKRVSIEAHLRNIHNVSKCDCKDHWEWYNKG